MFSNLLIFIVGNVFPSFSFFANGNYLQQQLQWYLFDLIFVTFSLILYCARYHGKKSCYLIKIYLKYISYFKVLKNVEREKYENKIISLQEFLKKKKLLTINYVYPIEKNIHIPLKLFSSNKEPSSIFLNYQYILNCSIVQQK